MLSMKKSKLKRRKESNVFFFAFLKVVMSMLPLLALLGYSVTMAFKQLGFSASPQLAVSAIILLLCLIAGE